MDATHVLNLRVNPHHCAMITVPAGFFIPGSSGGGGGAITDFAYLGNAIDSADLATYTFPAFALGSADANRQIIVGFATRAGGARTIVSATIGGVSATIDIQQASGQNDQVAILRAKVPSGSTGDIVVELSGGSSRAGIFVYRCIASSLTLHDSDSGGGSTSVNMFLDGAAGGVAVGVAGVRQNSTNYAVFSGLTENDWTTPEVGALLASGASHAFISAESNRAITAASPNGVNYHVAAAVASYI